MKRTMLLFAVLATCLVASAQENEGRRERHERMDMAEVFNRQATRLAKELKLEKDAQHTFTSLYLDYQNTRFNVVNPKGGDQEVKEQNTDITKLTDEEAKELVEKNFDRQEKQLAVDREYYKKFCEILTPSQAARVFLNRGRGMIGRDANQQRNQRQGGEMRPGGFGGPDGGPGGFGGPGF